MVVMVKHPQLKIVSRWEGIVGYFPEAVGFSPGAAEGYGALDLDGNNHIMKRIAL